MSRVSDFDDLYASSRDRLLLQLYAYCGNADAAADALNEAFITASHHWHRVHSLEGIEGWLRQRAVRRLDGRVRALPQRRAAALSRSNAQLLAALGALDLASRRLLIVRRLGGLDLATAAREVGLTDGAAEQALARATSTLHSNGVDTTPAGLQAGLTGLRDDLGAVEPASARSLRRAGTLRRYAAGGIVALVVVAVATGAGTLAASRPFASAPAKDPPARTTTPPGPTVTTPPPKLDDGHLLTAAQVAQVDVDAVWQVVPTRPAPPSISVYGDCVQAVDNPPPNSSWIRDFTTGTVPDRSRVRQVLQLAPTDVEARRAYRQIIAGYGLCEGHQLVDYARVRPLGEGAEFVRLLEPQRAGSMVENVVISQSGPVVSVVYVTSPAGTASALSPGQVVRLAGAAVNRVCSEVGGGCAFPPYTVTSGRPPADTTAPGFLSVVDLPSVPRVTQPWVGTDPAPVEGNPSATACDETGFVDSGGTDVKSRSLVIPGASALPTLFGLTETRATFARAELARSFVAHVTEHVQSCHKRQVTLSVVQSSSFDGHHSHGQVWQLRQKVSKQKVVTFRVALVRRGSTVAEVTFTPVGRYDVAQPVFLALAKRAAVRLAR